MGGLVQENADQGNIVFLKYMHGIVHVCTFAKWKCNIGKPQNLTHERRRQTEWMRKRRATVKPSSAIRDQVSDLFSLFSSQRWLTVIAPSCCFSLSHSSEPLQSPREFCSLRNTTGVSQPDSLSLNFYQFYLCLCLFETHLYPELKCYQTTDWARHQNSYKNSNTEAVSEWIKNGCGLAVLVSHSAPLQLVCLCSGEVHH